MEEVSFTPRPQKETKFDQTDDDDDDDPRSRVLLDRPPVAQQLKNFPTTYGIRMIISAFSRLHKWSLS
jgi:hypothetical protein